MCIGGTPLINDKRVLSEGGVQVIVGTPGRITDLITRNII